MKTILQINTSLFSEAGHSSRLADTVVQNLRAHHPDSRVVVRDLARQPLPHLDATRFAALTAKPEQRTPEQQAVVAESDALIAELQAADIIVLGLPMYNFGVPSQLKAYFDHLARAGMTFRYTANGPEGLVGDRKVYVLAARGGFYQGTPADTETGFVRTFLNFIGIRDIEFVYAEGLNISAESKNAALAEATAAIERLAA
jgi:FMN-dependent NADH-azoreductase